MNTEYIRKVFSYCQSEVEGMHVSATERAVYKRCRRLWDYSSASRQSLRPIKQAHALAFGQGIHEALAAYYTAQIERGTPDADVALCAWNKYIEAWREQTLSLWPEEIDALEKSATLGAGMLTRYDEWARESDSADIAEVVAVEQPFTISFGEAQLVGRIDLIARDAQGNVWIVDHKTAGQKANEAMLPLDAQMQMYALAYQYVTGEPAEGVYYNVLVKKTPTEPGILKSGGLSKAKSISTTEALYRRAIEKHGLNETDYTDILTTLHAQGNPFFARYKLRYNAYEMMSFEENLEVEVNEMYSNPPIYPNPTKDCSYCTYRNLCLAENRGDDVDYIKQTEFISKKS